jgi:gliding motility-associated-like protein
MDPDSICFGDGIRLFASGGVVYEWEPAESLSDSHVADPVATPDTTTVYTVMITDKNGCEFIDSVEISVVPEIIADFEIERQYDCINPVVLHFKNLSERANLYFWDFGDGNTSVDFEPIHQYTVSDTVRTYRVTLTATSSFCNNEKTEEVRSVQPFVPNFVSPNGDGKNDRFVVRTDDRVKLRIFNRLGKLEYENDAYHDEWPEEGHSIGVYFYEIMFSDEKTTCKGWVEIRR